MAGRQVDAANNERASDRSRLAGALEELRRALSPSCRLLTNPSDLLACAFDPSYMATQRTYLPDAVLVPRSTADVSAALEWAARHRVPVTPRGAASSPSGGVLPLRGGLVINLAPWDEIVEVDAPNLQVLVRPGVVHANLNAHLARFNLFFPPDPGSSRVATIGGMVSNNSSGMRALKYGGTGHYVLGLEAVLPGGQVVVTGGAASRAVKNVTGLDLTHLFVGSEGTLGVITQIRLKLLPRPPARGVLMAAFESLREAGECALAVLSEGILPAAMELVDETAVLAARRYKPGLAWPEAAALLLFELDGSPEGVEAEGRRLAAVVSGRASSSRWASDPAGVEALWEGRRVLGAASAQVRPGATRIWAGEDVTVPIARVPEALEAVKARLREERLTGVLFGHVGDGNVHTALVADPRDPEEMRRVERFVDWIHRMAIEMGGATTGEHGVGAARAQYAALEHGPALAVMQQVKAALDPLGILNPGKKWES